eukprot:sb/3472651/
MAGAMFGALCLSLFLTLVFAPKLSAKLSIRQSLAICILTSFFSSILYVFDLNNGAWLTYTFFSRILQGIAIGILDVRLLDMMVQVFPDKTSMITAAYEISFSGCLMAGPVLGGYLYDAYGFWAPINLSGTMSVLLDIWKIYILLAIHILLNNYAMGHLSRVS